MALGTGVEVIASLNPNGSNWWTAENANQADLGLHIETDTIPLGSPELIPDTSLGSPWERGNDLGNTVVDGNIQLKLRYDALGALFALCMGGVSSPTSLGNGAYYHTLTLESSLAGYFGTYCVYDGVAVRECPSTKVTGFEIRGTGGQALDVSFPVMCDDRIVSGQVNTTLGSVTYRDDPRVIFDDVKIRINAQGGGALADSDSFYASDFSITLTRPHEAPFVTNRRSTRSEPIANGKPQIRLAFTEASYVDVSRVAALKARTAYKLDIDMLGARVIGTSAYYFRMIFEFPAVYYSSAAYPINGPSRIIPDLQMVCELANTAPTGMTHVTPMKIGMWCGTPSAFLT